MAVLLTNTFDGTCLEAVAFRSAERLGHIDAPREDTFSILESREAEGHMQRVHGAGPEAIIIQGLKLEYMDLVRLCKPNIKPVSIKTTNNGVACVKCHMQIRKLALSQPRQKVTGTPK